MSQQGLETIESTTQKTHEWISQIAETAHMEKRDAYKALRAGLQTVRVLAAGGSCRAFRRATSDAVARSLLRRMGEPSKVLIKMSRQEFLAAIQEKIVAGRIIDPLETTRDVVSIVANYVGSGEMEKVVHSFPQDMQPLFPALAAATP